MLPIAPPFFDRRFSPVERRASSLSSDACPARFSARFVRSALPMGISRSFARPSLPQETPRHAAPYFPESSPYHPSISFSLFSDPASTRPRRVACVLGKGPTWSLSALRDKAWGVILQLLHADIAPLPGSPPPRSQVSWGSSVGRSEHLVASND